MPTIHTRAQRLGVDLDAWYSLVAVGYMGGIYLLSSFSDRGVTGYHGIVQLAFNLTHIPLYAGLTFFFVQALGGRKVNGTLAWGPS